MHADHNVDLIPLRHWVKYVNRGYGPALYSPAELRARIGEFQADADFLSDLDGETLAPRTFAVGDLRIEAGRVTHIPDSFAFRVSAAIWGRPGPRLFGRLRRRGRSRATDPRRRHAAQRGGVGRGQSRSAHPHDRSRPLRRRRAAAAKNLILTHILDDRRESMRASAAQKSSMAT